MPYRSSRGSTTPRTPPCSTSYPSSTPSGSSPTSGPCSPETGTPTEDGASWSHTSEYDRWSNTCWQQPQMITTGFWNGALDSAWWLSPLTRGKLVTECNRASLSPWLVVWEIRKTDLSPQCLRISSAMWVDPFSFLPIIRAGTDTSVRLLLPSYLAEEILCSV